MGLFFSSDRFTRPGPGVRPDAPRKKGVARLAEIMGRGHPARILPWYSAGWAD